MSFQWAEYLSVAQELVGRTPTVPSGTEARQRVAISRAYYAAFCEARNWLIKRGATIPATGQAHSIVQQIFKNSADPKRRDVGMNLDRLHTSGKKADYRDSVTGLGKLMGTALAQAERVIKILQTLPP